jgi:outer membrane protein assembly factor BamE (lipoprotein component of BamABCDE complex)
MKVTHARRFLALACLVLGILGLVSCATSYNKPLVTRGLSAVERKDYIIQNGFGIPEPVKQAFLDGYVEVGMARDMVFQLYGAPNRGANGEDTWEYVNNRGTVVTGINFKNDKVEKVYGDPKGGLEAPQAH